MFPAATAPRRPGKLRNGEEEEEAENLKAP